MKKIINNLVKTLIFVSVFDICAADLTFKEIQPSISDRTPTGIKFYNTSSGAPGLVYKLTDSKTPGDIFVSQLVNSSWSEPISLGLLNQNNHALSGAVQLSNASNMVLIQGDNTDYLKLFGLTEAPVDSENEIDPILPDISNDDLIKLLGDNQRLFFSINNESKWSSPQVIHNTNGALNAILLESKNNTAIAVYAKDSDSDESTINDIDLYYVFYSNGSWKNPVQLTNNSQLDYGYKAQFVGGQFVLTWMQDEDGNIQTTNDNRLFYSTVNNLGVLTTPATTIIAETNSNQVYAVGNDGANVIAVWSSQLPDKTYKLNETRFNGSQWSEVQSIDISVPDFKNASIFSVFGNTLMVYQRGNNINIAKYNGTNWLEIVVIDSLAKEKINFNEITYNIIDGVLWVAYSGHVPVVNEEENLSVGSGLYAASYPLSYDLAVADITTSSDVLNIGQESNLLVNIRNEGLVASNAFQINILRNNILETTLNAGALDSGAIEQFNYKFVPQSVEMNYKIEIVSTGQDADVSNNSKNRRITINPDYYIKDVQRTDLTHIRVDVRERKNIASPSVGLKAYLQIAGTQTELASTIYNPTSMDPVVLEIVSLATLTTDYKVLVKVNPSGDVIEDNYSNNFAAYSYKIDTLPDYHIEKLIVTDSDVQIQAVNSGIINSVVVDLLLTDNPEEAALNAALPAPWHFQQVSFDAQGVANIAIPRSSLPQLNGQYLYAVINPYSTVNETNNNNNSRRTLVVPGSTQADGIVSLVYQNENYICSNLSFDIENTGNMPAKGIKASIITESGAVLALNQLPFLSSGGVEHYLFHNIPLGSYYLKVAHYIDGKYVEQIQLQRLFNSDNCTSTDTQYDLALNSLTSLGIDATTGDYMFEMDVRATDYVINPFKPLFLPITFNVQVGTTLVETIKTGVYLHYLSDSENIIRSRISSLYDLPSVDFSVVATIGPLFNEVRTSNNTLSVNVSPAE